METLKLEWDKPDEEGLCFAMFNLDKDGWAKKYFAWYHPEKKYLILRDEHVYDDSAFVKIVNITQEEAEWILQHTFTVKIV